MNIVPTNMLGTAAQAIQSNPMFSEMRIQEMLDKFEADKLASLQAGQERTAQYRGVKEELGGQIKQAGEEYATAPKWGKADYAMTAASLILPLIGALLPQGRGLRGQRAKAGQQQALTGLGQGLGAVQQYRLGREEAGRERQYTGEMKGLEHLSGLADMIYQGQERQAATQMGAAGTQAQLGMRGLGVAAQYQKAMQPKVDKEPTTIEAVIAGYLNRGEEIPPDIMSLYREKLAGKPSTRQARVPPNIAQLTRGAYGTALGKWEGGKRAWDKAHAPSTMEMMLAEEGQIPIAEPYTEPKPTLGGVYDARYRDYATARGLDPDSIANVLGLGGQQNVVPETMEPNLPPMPTDWQGTFKQWVDYLTRKGIR